MMENSNNKCYLWTMMKHGEHMMKVMVGDGKIMEIIMKFMKMIQKD